MKTRSNMPLFVVECSDVKALSNSQIDLLRCGDYLVKKDETGEHAYKVTFKKDGVGMCLTYTDASVVETQSYDYVDGNWVYNSEDKTDLLAKPTADDIDSGDATDGQVLTADGDGGASWETIPEPQTGLYLHVIKIEEGSLWFQVNLYTKSSTPFDFTSLINFLKNKNMIYSTRGLNAIGKYKESSSNYLTGYLFYYNDTNLRVSTFQIYSAAPSFANVDITSSATFSDFVVEM